MKNLVTVYKTGNIVTYSYWSPIALHISRRGIKIILIIFANAIKIVRWGERCFRLVNLRTSQSTTTTQPAVTLRDPMTRIDLSR